MLKMKKNNIVGLFFPFFLNIYLFLFNTQYLVQVEYNICHLLFEAVLPDRGIVGLTGFSA